MESEPTVLFGAISALFTALIYVARTAYNEMKAERDFYRQEILTALTAIIQQEARSREERDRMIKEVLTGLGNMNRTSLRVVAALRKKGIIDALPD